MLTNTSEENVPDLNIVLLSTDVIPMSAACLLLSLESWLSLRLIQANARSGNISTTQEKEYCFWNSEEFVYILNVLRLKSDIQNQQ